MSWYDPTSWDWASVDPTNPSNTSFDWAGLIPVAGPLLQAAGTRRAAENARERAEGEARERRRFYDELGAEIRGVPTSEATKTRAAGLGDLRTREIDRGMYGAERAISGGYSRRGIGGSGYATAAQGQAIQAAGAERARARAAALEQAVAEGERGILSQAQISRMGDPFLSMQFQAAEAQYAAALQEAARQRDEYQAMMLRLIGNAVGGGEGAGGGYTGGGTGPGVQAPEYIYG